VAVSSYLTSPPGFAISACDVRSASELSYFEFNATYAQKQPVVIRGAFDGMPAVDWTKANFVENCKDALVTTYEFKEAAKHWANLKQVGNMSLSDYLTTHFTNGVAATDLYGFEMQLKLHCPAKLEEFEIPKYFPGDFFHFATNMTGLGWPSVLFGPQGTQTGLHIDTHRLPFWIAVFDGEGPSTRPLKHFRTFSHEDNNLRKYGRQGSTYNYHFDFDPWKADLEKFPLLEGAVAKDAFLRHGDLLYIPGGSPHAVKNMADNIGLSMNFMDRLHIWPFVKACNRNSPLCNIAIPSQEGFDRLYGIADHVHQQPERSRSYFEFAGGTGDETFCISLRTYLGKGYPALDSYCAPVVKSFLEKHNVE